MPGQPPAAKDYRLVVFAADKKLWTPNSRYFRMGGPDKNGRFKTVDDLKNVPGLDFKKVDSNRDRIVCF